MRRERIRGLAVASICTTLLALVTVQVWSCHPEAATPGGSSEARRALADAKRQAEEALRAARAAARAGFTRTDLASSVVVARGTTSVPFPAMSLSLDLGRLCLPLPSAWRTSNDVIRDEHGDVVTLGAALVGERGLVQLHPSALVHAPTSNALCFRAPSMSEHDTQRRTPTPDDATFSGLVITATAAFRASGVSWDRDPAADINDDMGL